MSLRLRITVIGLALLGIFAYLQSIFLFNPLTFRQDEILHLPWSWYRAPLQIEYGVLEEGGWKFVRLSNSKEIRQVFSELKRAERAAISVTESAEAGRPVWFGVRRTKDNAVLLNVRGYEGSPDFTLGANTPVRLTVRLQDLLYERLSLARIMAIN